MRRMEAIEKSEKAYMDIAWEALREQFEILADEVRIFPF